MTIHTTLKITDSEMKYHTSFHTDRKPERVRNEAVERTFQKWRDVWDRRQEIEIYYYDLQGNEILITKEKSKS